MSGGKSDVFSFFIFYLRHKDRTLFFTIFGFGQINPLYFCQWIFGKDRNPVIASFVRNGFSICGYHTGMISQFGRTIYKLLFACMFPEGSVVYLLLVIQLRICIL